jgi:DNA repair protein RecN (Recombination protein N)
MLRELRIKDFAIIDTLNLSFSEGLNVLSGETGAGKSIIVGALSLLLGGRASTEMVRSSKETAAIEALFECAPQGPVAASLKRWEIDWDDYLVLKRVVSCTGKSKAFINGAGATLQMLNQLGADLLGITGQHEHQSLLAVDKHIDILDTFGNLHPLRGRVEQGYRKLFSLHRRLNDLKERERDKVQRGEFLRFQLKEIEDANLSEGEDASLRKERAILANAQKLMALTGEAYDLIYHRQGSVLEHLRESLAKLKEVRATDGSVAALTSTLETVFYQTEDVGYALKEYQQKINCDPDRLEVVEGRLDEINRIKKKYGDSLEEIDRQREQLAQELDELESSEAMVGQLTKEIHQIEKETAHIATQLSRKRADAASRLSERTREELGSLGMKKAHFKVELAQEPGRKGTATQESLPLGTFTLTPKGIDTIEFFFGPNPGEGLRPLVKIASGGELSRIALALKKIVTQKKLAATLVFDEVDSGIGGATAEVVGKKLKEISHFQQTICITHLPQIASFADVHQIISKKLAGGRTTTSVQKLESPEERAEEVARMLGGTTITTKTREHAREMLKKAQGST